MPLDGATYHESCEKTRDSQQNEDIEAILSGSQRSLTCSLKVGIPLFNIHHNNYIVSFLDLREACRNGDQVCALILMRQILMNTAPHFAGEEAFTARIGMPGSPEHNQIHIAVYKELNAFAEELLDSFDPDRCAEKAERLFEMLLRHIQKSDGEYADMVRDWTPGRAGSEAGKAMKEANIPTMLKREHVIEGVRPGARGEIAKVLQHFSEPVRKLMLAQGAEGIHTMLGHTVCDIAALNTISASRQKIQNIGRKAA